MKNNAFFIFNYKLNRISLERVTLPFVIALKVKWCSHYTHINDCKGNYNSIIIPLETFRATGFIPYSSQRILETCIVYISTCTQVNTKV